MHRRHVAIALIALIALAGCGDAPRSRARAERSASPRPVAATRTPAPAVGLDWNAPGTGVDLDGGVRFVDCEGDAPLVCVERAGDAIGVLEILSYPVASAPDLERDLARSERAALDGHVRRFLESVRSDRAVGCPAGFRVDPLPTSYLSSADGVDLVRYGFTATTAEGRPAERMVQYASVRDGRLVLLAASAIDPAGCLSREGAEFTTADLTELENVLDDLVRRSRAPRATDR